MVSVPIGIRDWCERAPHTGHVLIGFETMMPIVIIVDGKPPEDRGGLRDRRRATIGDCAGRQRVDIDRKEESHQR